MLLSTCVKRYIICGDYGSVTMQMGVINTDGKYIDILDFRIDFDRKVYFGVSFLRSQVRNTGLIYLKKSFFFCF